MGLPPRQRGPVLRKSFDPYSEHRSSGSIHYGVHRNFGAAPPTITASSGGSVEREQDAPEERDRSNTENPSEGETLLHLDPATSLPTLTNGGNQPEHIEKDDQCSNALQYQHVRMLGHGGSASVEMVRDLDTGSVYARKITRVYSRNVQEAKRKFLNEVEIMRRLAAHHHVVQVHATYIERRELTIILDPVADGGDLAGFLQNYRDQGFSWHKGYTNDENLVQNNILRKAPYCLASALAFIHKQTIRHKDIKPQNILIHRGHVMYTDFGSSYDFGDAGRSTTTGYPQGMTRRYCAPEVIECGSRNSKSDVFSLGCVFVEIYLALANDAEHDQMYEGPYHEVVQSDPDGLLLPDIYAPPHYCAQRRLRISTLFRATIPKMMLRDPNSRFSACAIANLILTDENFNRRCDLCLECCKSSTSVDSNKFLRLLPTTI